LPAAQPEERLGVVARDDRMACKGELQPTAERGSVYGCHDRLLQARETAHRLGRLEREALGIGGELNRLE
jgi:hypothetical protein